MGAGHKFTPPTPGDDVQPIKVGSVKLEAHRDHGRVYINAEQYFEGVVPQVWQFQIGGYPVAEKWLKDRRGRQLNYDDKMHYPRVLEALRRTIERMQAIEEAAARTA